MRSMFLMAALLTLAGCGVFRDLTPMPSGYAYYQEPYKAQPPKYAPGIGYPWSAERNAVVIEKWEAVARTLVTKLEREADLRPNYVYLEMLPQDNAFNFALDHVLRKELLSRGYTLMHNPRRSIHLRPEAYLPSDERRTFELKNFNQDIEPELLPAHPERARDFVISIAVVRDEDVLGKVQDIFRLPAYGYVRDEGRQRLYDRVDYLGTKPVPAADLSSMPEQLVPVHVESEAIGSP